MAADYLLLAAIGFVAQLVDGALGMAFGLISTSTMLAMGVPPAQASAIVHTAEIFTTAGSAASHIHHRNIDWRLVLRLGVAGVIGAALGAWLLANVDARAVRPFVALYLMAMGLLILTKALGRPQSRDTPFTFAPPLGFVGGFLDASGGGGWGPIVTSTLVGSGHAPRIAVGSVSATEFFVTIAAAATFFVELGAVPLAELAALVVGGLAAAPFAGYAAKRVPPRPLMLLVALLVIALAGWQIARALL